MLKKKNSLAFHMISRVLAVTLPLFALILSLLYFYSRSTIEESSRENAIHIAENAVAKIEIELRSLEKVAQMMAVLMEHHPIPPDSISSFLERVLEENETVFAAAVAFEPFFFPEKGEYFSPYAFRRQGEIETMLLGGENYDYFYMDWYQIPVMLEESYWTEPYFDEGGGEMLMSTFSLPFYRTNEGLREVAGVATVDISLEWLTEIVADIRIFETGYAFMLSRGGVAVTHPDPANIMNESLFSLAEQLGSPLLREIGRDMISGESRFREHGLQQNGGRLWIYHTPLPSSNWSIGLVYPDDEMFATLYQISLLMMIFSIGGLFLLTFLIVKMVNRAVAPLTLFSASAREIASGTFDTPLPPVEGTDEIRDLHDSFSHMQKELATYIENLRVTTAAKEKIESELRIARDIQLSMIPHTFPPFPNLPQIDLFAMLKSAREVGGDLYDFFLRDDDRFVFAVGDVSGKGVPASLFMAMTRTLLRTISDRESEPGKILESLNKSLAFNNESSMFVTFFLGILDLKTGMLQYANAGHNPPVLIRNKSEVEEFETATGIPLGLFEEYEYSSESRQLKPGDKIFAYTDGVSEAENAKHELFEEENVMAELKACSDRDTRGLIAGMETAVQSHVNGYEQSDDITMMAVHYKG